MGLLTIFAGQPIQSIMKTFSSTVVLLLVAQLLFSQNTKLEFTETPEWIEQQDLPKNLQQIKREGDLVNVYNEEQINYLTDEIFSRSAFKVNHLNSRRLPYSIYFTHHPTTNSFHPIEVSLLRDGQKVILNQELKIQEIDEKELVRNQLYYSTKKIKFYFNDLEKGDLILISYLEKNLRDDIKQLPIPELRAPTGTPVYYRVISSKPLAHHEISGLLSPTERETRFGHELVWKGTYYGVSSEGAPSWYYSEPMFNATPFKNYQELSDWMIPLFQLDSSAASEVKAKYIDLTTAHQSKDEKIAAIINYVQDSIKYLEYGLYQPYSPARVMTDGFGDCKSKSLLGSALLNQAGVPAWPLLVNSNGYEHQFSDIATPQKFDHCVIQFAHGGDTITVDPTIPYQGDQIGQYEINDFGRGYQLIPGTKSEVSIDQQGYRKVEVYDLIEFDEKIKRKIVLEGVEADKMRRQYLFGGDSEIVLLLQDQLPYNQIQYRDLIYLSPPYEIDWSLNKNITIEDINSTTSNQFIINLNYELDEFPRLELPDLIPLYFEGAFETSEFDSTLLDSISIPSIEVYYQIKFARSDLQTFLDKSLHIDTINIKTDFCRYKVNSKLYQDSLILSQFLSTSRNVKTNDIVAFESFLERIEQGREQIAPVSNKVYQSFTKYKPDKESTRLVILLSVSALILFFFIVGLIKTLRRIYRVIKFIRIQKARRLTVLFLILFLALSAKAQHIPNSEVPDWVVNYPKVGLTESTQGIHQVRQEVQINDITKEEFHREIYKVSQAGLSKSHSFELKSESSIQTIELAEAYILRNGKVVNLMDQYIQVLNTKESKGDLLLKSRTSIVLRSDDFKSGDLLTISYLLKYDKGREPAESDYKFTASDSPLECENIFRVIKGEGKLHYKSIIGFGEPELLNSNGFKAWEWTETIKAPQKNNTNNEYSKCYVYLPEIFVFSYDSQKELGLSIREKLSLEAKGLNDNELDSIIVSIIPKDVYDTIDSITAIDKFVRHEISNLYTNLNDPQLTTREILSHHYASWYGKCKLFSYLLRHIGISNEIVLVKEFGMDPLYQEVLSSHIFTHAIVKYEIEGRMYYFDPTKNFYAPKVTMFEKVDYKYGINLDSLKDESYQSTLTYPEQNELEIKDTVDVLGNCSRTMIASGWVASELRDLYYNPDVELSKVIKGELRFSLKTQLNTRLSYEAHFIDLDSLVFKEELPEQVIVKVTGSLDSTAIYYDQLGLEDIQFTVNLQNVLDQWYPVEDNGPISYEFPIIKIKHAITIEDTVLKNKHIPDLDLKSKSMGFRRWSQFHEDYFTLNYEFESTTDYINSTNHDYDYRYAIQNATGGRTFNLNNLQRDISISRKVGYQKYGLLAFKICIGLLFCIITIIGILSSARWIIKRTFKPKRPLHS
ncbi:MAG: transglutaminase domain-containing protein [Bacteroidota bacterium]